MGQIKLKISYSLMPCHFFVFIENVNVPQDNWQLNLEDNVFWGLVLGLNITRFNLSRVEFFFKF